MSKNINVTELDFDTIKTNLKNYLKDQTVFQDYDFEGSGLSVLLDILAYNTHYNAIYNNLSINEMFLDSARKRNSVVSIAKELGYRPSSAICARATVDVTCKSITPTTFTIPINSPFNTNVNGVTYTFYNSSVLSSTTLSTTYTFKNVELIEKSNILSYKYTAGVGAKYIIPNQYADLSTLKVTVQENSGSSNIITYTIADNIVDVTGTSNVFWIKEIDDGLYELIFGNNIIGSALTNGNVINIDYCVSSLDLPNGAKIFSYFNSPPSGVSITPSIVSAASGGSLPEDIDSIRFNAPRSYSAQNRGVTPNDYKALIYSNFPEAKSINVWGGEDNTPPIYGKVFISIKPKSSDLLTIAQKDFILNTILPSKKLVTIIPEILDASYTEVIVNTTVYYNDLLTTRTADTIKSIVSASILNYDSLELQQFNGIFRYSKFTGIIDSSESSIINNITTITLKTELVPKYNIFAEYIVSTGNPIYYSGVPEDMILSSGFYVENSVYAHYITDDGIGNVVLFYKDSNNFRVPVNNYLGTVDYSTGIIKFKNLKITSLKGVSWFIYIKPSSNDVVSSMSKIVQLSTDDLNITVISDKSASGDLRGGKNYTFTTSRI